MAATQLGLATMDGRSASRPPFTSGTTRGMSTCMRKAEELSTTRAPLAAAIGANSRLIEAPAAKMAMSTPVKLSALSASTATWRPWKL